MAAPFEPSVENSGSLTGHILAQGWADTSTEGNSTTRVAVVLMVGVGILVAVGLLVVMAVGDLFNGVFGGLIDG